MISLVSRDSLLEKAFHLACFILGDREAALRVVAGALAKLEVATADQGKRLYYIPRGRLWSRRSQSNPFRNNISFNEPHLLQRLIYIGSEPYEIAQEQAKGSAAVGEEDLVVHFIKHLTKKTVKRNSFYVTLGLSRLLYSYTTAETMDIYNAVIQDPERVKDDYYYRSRKGVLMQELKQRFGDLINIYRGPRGEERFQAFDNQSQFIELVRDCLSFFTPWQTPCLVPAGIDPITDGISSFSYQGDTEEDKIEMNRIHAVLHPDCFQRLIADLRFDAPDSRLEIPRFFYANDMNDNGQRNERRHPPKLDEQELMSIKDAFGSNAARRKAAHAGVLRVMVDGIEEARIDLNDARNTRFSLDRDAELIEVRSRDDAGEELLLASHLFCHGETENSAQSADASIVLEGGQKISIRVAPTTNEIGAVVDISYRETNPFRAASLFFHQLAHSISGGPSRGIWNGHRIFVPAITLVLLAVCLGVVIRYVRKGNERATEQTQVVASRENGHTSEEENRSTKAGTYKASTSTATETKTSTSNTAPQKGTETRQQSPPAGASSKTENTARNSEQPKPDIATGPGTVTETETRSVTARPAGVSLSAVEKVYIEASGGDKFSQSVLEMLGERLRASHGIILVHNRNDADALLKVTVVNSTSADPDGANVLVELLNARGNVIWPSSSAGGKYEGSPFGVSGSIVKDLLSAIQKSKQRR